MVHRSALLGLAALAIGLCGCGGHQSDSSVSVLEGNPLTATQVNALGKRMNGQYYQYKAVKKLPHPLTNLQTWAKTQPEVQSVSLDEPRGVLQLNLKSGRRFMFLDNFRVIAPPQPRRRELGGKSLPNSLNVRFLGGTASEFRYWQEYVPYYTGMLKDAGYKNVSAAPFTVENLKAASGVGLLAINAHGGFHGVSKLPFMASLTLVSDANEKAYAKELAYVDGLFYMRHYVPVLHIQSGSTYGILPGFVRRNLKLAPHALAILYVCHQGEGNAYYMPSAFQIAGADGVIAWNGPASTTGVDNLYTLFDQLLGSEKSDTMISKLDPPQRPFEIGPVWSNLAAHKGTQDAGNGSIIRYIAKSGSGTADGFGILRPSIKEGMVEGAEGNDKLKLRGIFGKKQGTVKVSGEEITVDRWEETEIEAQLPDTGTGAYGPVTVEVDGIKSNERVLACWDNSITATVKGEGTLWAKVTIQVKMRAMVQNGRAKPDTAPPTQPFSWPVVLNEATKGTFSSGGTFTTGDETVKWAGSGTLTGANIPGSKGSNKVNLWASDQSGTGGGYIVTPKTLVANLVAFPKVVATSNKKGTSTMEAFPVPVLDGFIPPMGDEAWTFKVGGQISATSKLVIPKATWTAKAYPKKDEQR